MLFLSGAFLVLWYDDEHGEGKRLKKQLEDSRYAKENSEKELQKTIWENCGKKIRTIADVATLQMQNRGVHETEGGWLMEITASDSTGSGRLSCYTDKQGRVIRIPEFANN